MNPEPSIKVQVDRALGRCRGLLNDDVAVDVDALDVIECCGRDRRGLWMIAVEDDIILSRGFAPRMGRVEDKGYVIASSQGKARDLDFRLGSIDRTLEHLLFLRLDYD